MSTIEHFATRSIQPEQRLDYWNRVASDTFSGLAVDAPPEGFEAQMWRWSVADLTLARPLSNAARIERWADSDAPGLDRIIVHLQHRGRSRNRQQRSDADLSAGDFALCIANERYRVDISDRNEMLVVELPRAALAERLPGYRDLVSRRIAGSAVGTRLLRDFLLSLWRQGDQSEADPDWQKGVAGVVADLLALALREEPPRASQAGRRLDERLAALVEAHLADPELRTATLADALNLSMRSVQHAFAALGTTPSGYILERRLQRAAERLAADDRRSITSIAYDLGFNDSAYFTRCFRQRFGTTPSAWRACH